ncbi:uncharacterized protein LOC122404355 [Colletes gigas]|uniref:uncharacterized protein LOC122404355 n=1 Tax=Colletes gigas TaxID=935657 RepID=UPI001C9ACD66|nr:uncharacterized protein LOC122404355 [Colletes gigas]
MGRRDDQQEAYGVISFRYLGVATPRTAADDCRAQPLRGNTLSFSKCWQSNEIIGISKNNSSSHRLVIVHAGGENGFINGAELIYKPTSTVGDYHGQMDAEKFEKWIVEKLLPNIPQSSVVVMDNAPYHSTQINKPPTKSSTKAAMVKWLTENNITFSFTMRKFQLFDLVEKSKPQKSFKIDQIMRLHGHNILRLPPYNCDLNPIELIWAELKRKLRERNISTYTKDELETYTSEAIRGISVTHWSNCCKHIEKLENEYWEKDGLLEDIMESMGLITTDEETDAESECSTSSNNE